jgi:hypothetical protein
MALQRRSRRVLQALIAKLGISTSAPHQANSDTRRRRDVARSSQKGAEPTPAIPQAFVDLLARDIPGRERVVNTARITLD